MKITFKFHYVQMKQIRDNGNAGLYNMFKFHYVQMKQIRLFLLLNEFVMFKFHYVQMKRFITSSISFLLLIV